MPGHDVRAVRLAGAPQGGDHVGDDGRHRDAGADRLHERLLLDGEPAAGGRGVPLQRVEDPVPRRPDPADRVVLRGQRVSRPERHQLLDGRLDPGWVDLREQGAELGVRQLRGRRGRERGWLDLGVGGRGQSGADERGRRSGGCGRDGGGQEGAPARTGARGGVHSGGSTPIYTFCPWPAGTARHAGWACGTRSMGTRRERTPLPATRLMVQRPGQGLDPVVHPLQVHAVAGDPVDADHELVSLDAG